MPQPSTPPAGAHSGIPRAAENILVWFRRDMRVHDHAALHHALRDSQRVHCVFIFDSAILAHLPRRDRRLDFLLASVSELAQQLHALGGQLIVRHADAAKAIPQLAAELRVDAVYCNRDYEPQAIARDSKVAQALAADGRRWRDFKDQVIFDKNEVLSLSGQPFSIFTPYKNAWLKRLRSDTGGAVPLFAVDGHAARLAPGKAAAALPTRAQLGFEASNLASLPIPTGSTGAQQLFEEFMPRLASYAHTRDFPGVKGPSYLSVHLRFGTISIRQLVRHALAAIDSGQGGDGAAVWLSELIWRDFYSMRSSRPTISSYGKAGRTPTPASRPGAKAAPATRWSMPQCAS